MSGSHSSKHAQVAGIDLLRIVGAGMVMAFHLFFLIGRRDSTATLSSGGVVSYPEFEFVGWGTAVGVELLFVISGFVIAYSASGSTPSRFLRSRLLRLFPTVLICAPITAAVAAFTMPWSPEDLAARLLRSITFWPTGPQIDGPYWTLGVEVAFYAGVFVLLVTRRFSWLEQAITIVGLVSLSLWILQLAVPDWPQILGTARLADLLLLRHGTYFAVGVFLWLGCFDRWTPRRVAFLLLFVAAGALPILADSQARVARYDFGPVELVPVAVWFAAIACTYLSIVRGEAITRRLGPVAQPIRILALATYPIYLLHSLVGGALIGVLVRAGIDRFVALGATLVAIVALSLLVTTVLEPAVRHRMSQVLDLVLDRGKEPARAP